MAYLTLLFDIFGFWNTLSGVWGVGVDLVCWFCVFLGFVFDIWVCDFFLDFFLVSSFLVFESM